MSYLSWSWSRRVARCGEFRVNPGWTRDRSSGRWGAQARTNLRRRRHLGHDQAKGADMRHAGLIATLLVFIAGGAGAETVLDRANRGAIGMVARDDPDMAAAMRKARETLPGFLALARVPPPTVTTPAVKVAIED